MMETAISMETDAELFVLTAAGGTPVKWALADLHQRHSRSLLVHLLRLCLDRNAPASPAQAALRNAICQRQEMADLALLVPPDRSEQNRQVARLGHLAMAAAGIGVLAVDQRVPMQSQPGSEFDREPTLRSAEVPPTVKLQDVERSALHRCRVLGQAHLVPRGSMHHGGLRGSPGPASGDAGEGGWRRAGGAAEGRVEPGRLEAKTGSRTLI
ncbi:hypothetical protein CATMQ487_29640 [Sphaerotilus microaerophilus]|jgi:hypothetical protein|uniref:Uncharacterized protein n=1 Tax=Sphaerotilus microaerophilus TaxID=2914710 RepID=A0ABM7YND9_9BURK|nr:hypothetical protein CATMQ487_29640 [Sphaerotilus sp. FB-5]